MGNDKQLKRHIAISMFILCGVCLTALSMLMTVGSDRL